MMTDRPSGGEQPDDRAAAHAGRRDGIVIAIDGPAASGKSSTAREVASALGYRHLDSGAFYRTVTLAALEAGIPEREWSELTTDELEKMRISAAPARGSYRLTLRGEDVGDRIRSPEVNANVSRIAALPAVREWLLGALRDTGKDGGLVADGRDIGTVVFPDAELKIFLVCAPEERATRRLREQGVQSPKALEIDAEAARLVERDRKDSERKAAPLVQAADAIVLDTTHLDFHEQVASITRLALARLDQTTTTQSLDADRDLR